MQQLLTTTNTTWRRDFACLLVLTALAATLRLTGLDRESIWYDEAASIDLAKADAVDLLTGRVADNGNPAGYFLLLHGWCQVFGGITIENARALSAVAGALNVPAIWFLARLCGLSRFAGLLGAFLVAISPPLVYLGQEARVFALFATISTLAAAAAVRAERGGGMFAWAGFALCGVLLVHLHYYGAFVLAALGLHLLIWSIRNDFTGVVKLGCCTVAVVLAFVPWLPVFRWQLGLGAGRSEATWWQHLALLPLFSVGGRTLVWKNDGLTFVAAVDLLLAALAFVPLSILLVRSRARAGFVVAFVLGVPLLAALVSVTWTPMITSHYLSCFFPALMLLMAVGLEEGWAQGPRALALLASAALSVAMILALTLMYAVPHKTDWRGVAGLVGKEFGHLPVYFFEDIGGQPFGYYRPHQSQHVVTESFGNSGSGWTGVLSSMNQQQTGFWFVFYPTNQDNIALEPAIANWLQENFAVEEEATFLPMRVWRCRPQSRMQR